MIRRAKAEENAHSERWLVSYADFVTLLFAVFVVLFASAYHDKQAIQRVAAAVKNGFQEMGSFSSYGATASSKYYGISQNGNSLDPTQDGTSRLNATRANSGIDVEELNRKLKKALGKEIEREEIDLRMTPEGFVISLHELGFFDSGQARLKPEATDKVKRIASILNEYGLDMRVEGHSDNIPIHNDSFNSNWELSTARATAVAMMLIDDAGVNPERMSIAGYGEFHPAASNDTPEGRRANRRVDIVVVAASRHSGLQSH